MDFKFKLALCSCQHLPVTRSPKAPESPKAWAGVQVYLGTSVGNQISQQYFV